MKLAEKIEQRKQFYEELLNIADSIPTKEYINLSGGQNAVKGFNHLLGVKKFHEPDQNKVKELLVEFFPQNSPDLATSECFTIP